MMIVKPNAVVFDVDGTLCDTRPLRHLVTGPQRDFDAFHQAAAQAPANQNVVRELHRLRNYGILAFILTARDGKWAGLTLDWLTLHHIPYDGFCTRPAGDNRPDHVVKAEMLGWISRHHNIIRAYDDRPRVIRMWHENRIPVTIVHGWYGDTDHAEPPRMSTYSPDMRLPAEYINDQDGWLVNMWRSIQLSPDVVAIHAYGPVSEIDYHARLAWLQDRRSDRLVAWLEGDPEHHDAKAAGWWLTVAAAGIGDPWGSGPWRVIDGHLVDSRGLPHLGNPGQGVNRELPHLGGQEQDGHRDRLTMYMRQLADRLCRVRITCGGWERVLTPSVTRAGTGGDGSRAIFLDPPYATSGNLYAASAGGEADRAREWCLTAPRGYRIILCGYDNEHDTLLEHGWRVTEGKSGGGAGYSNRPDNGRRERLWLSPACLDGSEQGSLFADE